MEMNKRLFTIGITILLFSLVAISILVDVALKNIYEAPFSYKPLVVIQFVTLFILLTFIILFALLIVEFSMRNTTKSTIFQAPS